MKKIIKFSLLVSTFDLGIIVSSTVSTCLVSTNENIRPTEFCKKVVTYSSSNTKNDFLKLIKVKNFDIKSNAFKSIDIVKYNSIFFKQEINSKNNASILLSTNNEDYQIKPNQEMKLELVFDSALKHIKKYGLTSNYLNSMFKKCHFSKEDYLKVSHLISFDKKDIDYKNNNVEKNLNFFSMPSNSLENSAISFNNYFKNNFIPNFTNYESTLYKVYIASSVAAGVSAADALCYMAGAWLFGITIPDAIAASTAAVADGTNAILLGLQYKKTHKTLEQFLNYETQLVNPLISAHSFANLKDLLSEDIKWIMGDYDFDFSEAPAVREEVLTEQTVSDMAIWAVPALGALDIISTLLDISIFIAASSAQTEFYTFTCHTCILC